MPIARDRALRYRELYEVAGVLADETLDDMLADRGIRLEASRSVPLPYEEIYIPGLLVFRAGISRRSERWNKAHVIGHSLLHTGNQWDLPPRYVALQERQADEFAGWLMWGDPAELRGGLRVTVYDVAELARSPLDCVERWWEIAGGELMEQPHYAVWARA